MSECSRLQNMAYQLLDMALLRRGEMEEEDCSVAALFEQSKKAMYVKAVEKKIHLSYGQSQDFFIRGNMEQLLIMLNNLIDNAMKASQPKGRIYVSSYGEESRVVVEVEDHGIGMDSDQISRIKEAFYRGDNWPKRKRKNAS